MSLAEIADITEAKNAGKLLIAQVSPSSRIGICEEFSMPSCNAIGKVATALKQLGIDYVVDTPLGADLVTYYEALEIKRMLESNSLELPFFNSCCTGWRLYASKVHPELLHNISPIISPQMATGAVSRYYIAKKANRNPSDIYVIGIMPCNVKRAETKERMKDGNAYVDSVLTTVELADWIKSKGIDFPNLPDSQLSEIFPKASKSALNFGSSGGVMHALISVLSSLLGEKIDIAEVKSGNGITEGIIKSKSFDFNVAIVYGFANFERVYAEIKNGKKYGFIEVMMCPNGCIGGPGQPEASKEKLLERVAVLNSSAEKLESANAINADFSNFVTAIEEDIGKDKLHSIFYPRESS